jgi:thymidylate synthase
MDPIIRTLEGNSIDKSYLELVKRILTKGSKRDIRNRATISNFVENISINLTEGFPLINHEKKYSSMPSFMELIWFIKGDTDARNLEREYI